MKTIKKLSKLAATGVLMSAFALNFSACTKQSPLASSDDISADTVDKKDGNGNGNDNDNGNGKDKDKDNDNGNDNGNSGNNGNANRLKFMSLQGGISSGDTTEPSTDVLTEVIGHVTFTGGGELILEYKGIENPQDNSGNLYVKSTFKVFSETISEDADLALTLFDNLTAGDVDVTFQPHGIVFSQPALLNIEVKDADLSSVDENTIGLYYVNQETGQWESMQTYDIIVKKNEGYLKIIDAQIPHFSRYALAWSN